MTFGRPLPIRRGVELIVVGRTWKHSLMIEVILCTAFRGVLPASHGLTGRKGLPTENGVLHDRRRVGTTVLRVVSAEKLDIPILIFGPQVGTDSALFYSRV
jgi:hypothetical protein